MVSTSTRSRTGRGAISTRRSSPITKRPWLLDVITRRANIELMFIDPYWNRLQFARAYKFAVPVLNVSMMISGTHREPIRQCQRQPLRVCRAEGQEDHDARRLSGAIEEIFAQAVAADTACLKSTQAYQRTLRYEDVPKERAAKAFDRKADELSDAEFKDFEDFMFWQIVKLSAKHDLPFQIHTGQARIQGSNPMLLVDLIQANPKRSSSSSTAVIPGSAKRQ